MDQTDPCSLVGGRPTEIIVVPSSTPAALRPAPSLPSHGPRRWPVVVASLLTIAMLVVVAVVVTQQTASTAASAYEIARYSEHQLAVDTLAISADGKLVASGDRDGEVHLWDTAERVCRHKLAGHRGRIISIDLSVDGNRVVTAATDGTVRVWNARDEQSDTLITGLGLHATTVVWHPGLTHCLVTSGGKVGLWDVVEKKSVWQQSLLAGEFRCLALASDGLRLLTGDTTGNIRIWQVATGRELGRCQSHGGSVNGVAASPLPGRALSCGDDGMVRLWDVANARLLEAWRISDPSCAIQSVTFSPGGTRFLTTDQQAQVGLWSCEDGQLLQSYSGHDGVVGRGCIFPNGQVAVSAGEDGTVRLWRLETPTSVELQRLEATLEFQKRRGQDMERFGRRLGLARQLVQEGKLDAAQQEFESAARDMDRESLEYSVAYNAMISIRDGQERRDRFAACCEAGKVAAERKDFAAAQQHFKRALEIFPDQKEAQEGLRRAIEANQLQASLGAIQIVRRLTFVGEVPEQGALRMGKHFAFLLPSANQPPDEFAVGTLSTPPMGLATSPLAWDLKIHLLKRLPETPVSLRIAMVKLPDEILVASKDYPLRSNAELQTLHGEVLPPGGAWTSGTYQVRSQVIFDGQTRDFEKPQEFAIGLIQWRASKIDLTPVDVQDANYALKTPVQVKAGDAMTIQAEGAVSPAPVTFYRELTGQPDLAAPVPATPEGLPWSPTVAGGQQYGLVDLKSNFGSLLMRIGLSGWIAYREKMLSQILPQDGTLELSINSIIQYRPKNRLPMRSVAPGDRTFWCQNCGSFMVTVYHGTFDLPEHVPPEIRILLARRFSP